MMQGKRLFVFSLLSAVVLCASVCTVFAKAPDTAKIVFTSRGISNKRDIFIMDTNGHNKINLTEHPADDIRPTWSPTGEHILFVSDREGMHDLYLMEPDGSNVRRVFEEKSHRVAPIWSPDGKRIAYVHNRLQLTLNIATKDGNGVEVLTVVDDHLYVNLAWSPDGTEIAFDNIIRLHRTHIVNLQTRTVAPLLPELQFVIHNVEWSPDGKQLAFAGVECIKNQACRIKNFDDLKVYIVNRDGTGVEQVVAKGDFGADYPVWSPRGNVLLYQQKVKEANRDFGQPQLFRLILGREKPKQLTAIGRNLYADWFDPAFALPVSPQPQLLTTQWGQLKKP
jgi:Tol biopolymer transport system component